MSVRAGAGPPGLGDADIHVIRFNQRPGVGWMLSQMDAHIPAVGQHTLTGGERRLHALGERHHYFLLFVAVVLQQCPISPQMKRGRVKAQSFLHACMNHG